MPLCRIPSSSKWKKRRGLQERQPFRVEHVAQPVGQSLLTEELPVDEKMCVEELNGVYMNYVLEQIKGSEILKYPICYLPYLILKTNCLMSKKTESSLQIHSASM